MMNNQSDPQSEMIQKVMEVEGVLYRKEIVMGNKEMEEGMKKETWLKRFVRKWNESVKRDKKDHFVLGVCLTYGGLMVGLLLDVLQLDYLIKTLCIILLINFFVAFGIEFFQSFTKNRNTDFNDFNAHLSGCMTCLSVALPLIIAYYTYL